MSLFSTEAINERDLAIIWLEKAYSFHETEDNPIIFDGRNIDIHSSLSRNCDDRLDLIAPPGYHIRNISGNFVYKYYPYTYIENGPDHVNGGFSIEYSKIEYLKGAPECDILWVSNCSNLSSLEFMPKCKHLYMDSLNITSTKWNTADHTISISNMTIYDLVDIPAHMDTFRLYRTDIYSLEGSPHEVNNYQIQENHTLKNLEGISQCIGDLSITGSDIESLKGLISCNTVFCSGCELPSR